MLRKITKYFGLLLLLLLGIFLLFPLWSSWIINANLPSGIALKNFESDYPGISQIFVRKLSLDVGGIEIKINALKLKYDLSLIDLKNITIQLPEPTEQKTNNTQPVKLESLKLPDLDFQIFDFLDKLQAIKINKLALINQSINYQLTDFNFSNNEIKNLQLKLKPAWNIYHQQKQSDLHLFLTLDSKNKKIDINISQNKSNLAEFSYTKTPQQTTFVLQVNLNRFQSLFVDHFASIPVTLGENTSINWIQDNKNNITEIKVKTILSVPNSLSKLSNDLTLPIDLSLTSDLKNKLNTKIMLEGRTSLAVEFNTDQTKLNFEPLSFNLETHISQIGDNNDFIIQVKNTQLNLSSPRLDVLFDGSELAFKQYKLNTTIQDLTVNLNKLDQAKWQVNSQLLSESLTGYYAKETKIDSKVNLDIELAKSDTWLSNVTLLLSELQITDPSFALNGLLSVDLQDVSADLNNGKILVAFDTNDNRLTDLDFDSLNIKTELFLQNKSIEGEGNILINEQNLTPFTMAFNKETSNFSIDLKENLLANQIFNHFLAIIGKRNKMPLQILEGETTHSGDLVLSENLLVASQISIKDMLFKFGENEIQGLNMTQKLTSISPLQFHSDVVVDSINFSSGLTIDNLSAKINASSSENVVIENVKGELLQGQIAAKNLSFDSEGLQKSVIQLNEISLTELVFFMDIEGLYAEGKINISLPLSTKSGSPVIKNGVFNSIEKGIIKYSTGEIDPQTDENIALQALRNFHYNSLDGTVSYNKVGKYHIKLHFLGSNPELYDGYPIDFVLHLRGELTGVFRSLFLTGSFDDAVMQQVKTGQLKQNEKKTSREQE